MTATTMDVRKALVDQIRSLAEKAFASHVIEQKLNDGLFRHWQCARPNEGVYHFNITTIPGRIIVTGDIGELIVQREPDMIPWCRGSLDSIGYFAEKVPHSMPTEEYDPDVAEAWMRETLETADEWDVSQEHQDQLRVLLAFNDFDYMAVSQVAHEISPDEFPNLNNWKPNFLWCREAIRFLVDRA